MTSRRGAVLVESALALPLILLFVYGSIQLGMVGLEQLTVDGGAYTAAHQTALLGANLNGYAPGATVAKAALPHLNASTVKVPEPTLGAAPDTQFSDTYNPANANARHGGVSMIQPVQAVGFAISTNFASLLMGVANDVSVTGVAIDPAFRLINGHGDVSGNSYNTPPAFLTASDPLVNGNNAPPYFVGFNFMYQCFYSIPANTSGWTACPTPQFAGIGLAEYLDTNNWGRPVNGVVPDQTAVFWEARLHQSEFATIASQLTAAGNTSIGAKASVLDPLGRGPDKDTECVYSFDNESLGSYAVGTVTIGTYPTHPAGDPAVCPP